jgi:hypothetical protein
MKLNILIVALLAILPCLNCSNSSSGDPLVNEDYGFLKAKIQGRSWAASKMQPDKYVSEILQIIGLNGKSALWIQVNKPEAGKTQILITTDLNHFEDEERHYYMVKRGTISVTKMNDQWVEGNFSFEATDDRTGLSIEVTEGEYKVPNPKRFK